MVNRNDIILIGLLLIAGCCLFFFRHEQQSGSVVEIYEDNNLVYTMDLNTNETYRFVNASGEYNEICVKNMHVSVTDADCPDRYCVHQLPVSCNNESIVCLPHKLAIIVSTNEEASFDAITK